MYYETVTQQVQKSRSVFVGMIGYDYPKYGWETYADSVQVQYVCWESKKERLDYLKEIKSSVQKVQYLEMGSQAAVRQFLREATWYIERREKILEAEYQEKLSWYRVQPWYKRWFALSTPTRTDAPLIPNEEVVAGILRKCNNPKIFLAMALVKKFSETSAVEFGQLTREEYEALEHLFILPTAFEFSMPKVSEFFKNKEKYVSLLF